MVGRHCCVPGCSSSTLRNKGVTFSEFPKDPDERDEWIRIILYNTDVNFKVPQRRPWSTPIARKPLGTKYQVLCGYHFREDGCKLKTDKYPIYFWKSTGQGDLAFSHEIEISENPNLRKELEPEVANLEGKISEKSSDSDTTTVTDHNYCLEYEPSSLASVIKHQRYSLLDLRSKLDGYDELKNQCNELLTKNLALKTKVLKMETEMKDFNELKTENVVLKNIISSQKLECLQYKSKIQLLEKSLRQPPFSLSKISQSPSMMKFYTGCENIEGFNDLYEFIEPDTNNLQFYNGTKGYKRKYKRNDNTKGRPMLLSFKNQLFMVLCRLKVGLLEQDLAYRFSISVSTVSNLCITWFDLLEKRLTKFQIWPSRAVVDEFMPEDFKLKFPKTRVIIDATELFVQKPNDFKTQSDTWSSYKTHNTAKGLIGITPNGFISFVSDLVPGRMSDKELTEESGLVSLLSHGDSVMADRGFLIEDLLMEKGVTLNMPPFLHDKAQLSLQEEKDTREIASLRIHVERVIRSVKSYHLLSTIFPNNMSSQLNKIWKICAYLVNFCNEPLLDVKK